VPNDYASLHRIPRCRPDGHGPRPRLDRRRAARRRSAASDPHKKSREKFQADTGIAAGSSNAAVVAKCRVLVLAVKPHIVPQVLEELREHVRDDHLIVSIAAGITLSHLQEGIGEAARIVRVMPNTPALVGQSATGFALGAKATAADAELVETLFRAVGLAYRLPEHLLDAVTGLSGSGPAYAYQFIEALSDGGVKMGLPRDVATQLAAQTILGAAKMVIETGHHPAALKDAVASPGGTTIAGLHALERAGFRAAAMDAVEAATLRAKELGQPPR
jgi:pyrroline-5-carboxylate reductase